MGRTARSTRNCSAAYRREVSAESSVVSQGAARLKGVLELVERRGSAALIRVERRLLAVGARDALQASRCCSQARTTAAPRAALA
jgi:hypothetical protein